MGQRLTRDEAAQRDRALLEAGDLDTLFALYWDAALAWIHSAARLTQGEAEEIRQDTFLRAMREIRGKGAHFNGVPFGGALFRMAGWTTDDYLGRAVRRGDREERMGDDEHHQPVDPRAAAEFDGIGEDDDMVRIFAGLPDREHTLMMLVYIDHHSLTEAADVMGITPNNAHQVHHRAKQRLAATLAEGRA